VLISPLVWQPRSNGQRHWYFMVAAGTEFRLNEFGADDKALARNMRASLTQALMQRQPPIVIHDFDDELEMMCWSEVLWPCAKTREIVAGIEAERAQWSTA
jgi:hypothetical protein